MPSAERTIVINSPPRTVFGYIADQSKAQQWRPGVLEIELQSGEGVGAVYRQLVRGPGGRGVAADFEITDYEPSSRLAFRTIAGPVRPVGLFQLDSVGAGTRLTFSLAAELSGLKRVALGRAVQKSMDAQMAGLDKLKSALEG